MSERKVQIPEKVFYELVKFHLLGETDAEEEIKTHLMKKLDALAEHQLYTRSKKAASQNEREQARKEYLESTLLYFSQASSQGPRCMLACNEWTLATARQRA